MRCNGRDAHIRALLAPALALEIPLLSLSLAISYQLPATNLVQVSSGQASIVRICHTCEQLGGVRERPCT